LRRIERMRTGIMRSQSTQARPQVAAVSSHLTPVFHHKLRARKMGLRNTPLPISTRCGSQDGRA